MHLTPLLFSYVFSISSSLVNGATIFPPLDALKHVKRMRQKDGKLPSLSYIFANYAQGLSRFTAFLARYRPEYQHLVIGYLETQKAIKAVEYANAVAQDALPSSTTTTKMTQQPRPNSAAQLNQSFQEASSNAFQAFKLDH